MQETLKTLLGERRVAYSPLLAQAVGGVKNAVMLSQLMYWADDRIPLDDDGYFWKRVKDFTAETGLTGYEQETARKALKKLGVIDAERKGTPYRWHYMVLWQEIFDLLDSCKAGIQIRGKHESRLDKPTNLESGNARPIEESIEIQDESQEKLNGKEKNAIRKSAEIDFKELTRLDHPARQSETNELWWTPLREICTLADWKPEVANWLMFESLQRLQKNGMTVSSPKSIIKTVRAIKAERDRGVFKQYNEPKGMTGLRDWLAQGA